MGGLNRINLKKKLFSFSWESYDKFKVIFFYLLLESIPYFIGIGNPRFMNERELGEYIYMQSLSYIKFGLLRFFSFIIKNSHSVLGVYVRVSFPKCILSIHKYRPVDTFLNLIKSVAKRRPP